MNSEQLKKRSSYMESLSPILAYVSKERKIMNTIVSKISIFWKKSNKIYPFTFKQKRLIKNDHMDIKEYILEKQQFDFKLVNPNQRNRDI